MLAIYSLSVVNRNLLEVRSEHTKMGLWQRNGNLKIEEEQLL